MQVDLTELGLADLDWLLEVEARARAEGFIRGNDRASHEAYMAREDAAYLKILSDGKPAGYIILSGVGQTDEVVELGRIVIDEPFRGIGQRVMRLVIDHIFDTLGAHKIYLDTLDHNHRGQHIYEKLGFVQEGRLRESFRMGEARHDMLLYGLLRSEWKRVKAAR